MGADCRADSVALCIAGFAGILRLAPTNGRVWRTASVERRIRGVASGVSCVVCGVHKVKNPPICRDFGQISIWGMLIWPTSPGGRDLVTLCTRRSASGAAAPCTPHPNPSMRRSTDPVRQTKASRGARRQRQSSRRYNATRLRPARHPASLPGPRACDPASLTALQPEPNLTPAENPPRPATISDVRRQEEKRKNSADRRAEQKGIEYV